MEKDKYIQFTLLMRRSDGDVTYGQAFKGILSAVTALAHIAEDYGAKPESSIGTMLTEARGHDPEFIAQYVCQLSPIPNNDHVALMFDTAFKAFGTTGDSDETPA